MVEKPANRGWAVVRSFWLRAQAWAERRPRMAWLVVLALVLGVASVEAAHWPLNDFPGAMWHHPTDRGIDVEATQARAAVVTWDDLVGFWSGPYIDGNPTFRPLSAWLFTAEYRLFGRADRLWCRVSIGLHLVAVLLLTWAVATWIPGALLERLAVGAGAALVFAAPGLADRSVQMWALGWWPCQPDLLTLICALPLLTWVVLYVRTGARRWAALAAGAFLLGLCFKEMMYVAGLGACLLLVRHPKRWGLLAAVGIIGVCAFAYRSVIYTDAPSELKQHAGRLLRALSSHAAATGVGLMEALPHLVALAVAAVVAHRVARSHGSAAGAGLAAALYLLPLSAFFGPPTDVLFQTGASVALSLVLFGALLVGFSRAARSWPVPEIAATALGSILMGLAFQPILAWHRYWGTALGSALVSLSLWGLVILLGQRFRTPGAVGDPAC